MTRRTVTAALAVCCGLSAMLAGWFSAGGPRQAPEDAGALPSAASARSASGADAPTPPMAVRGPGGFRAPLVPVAAGADGALALRPDGRTGGWWALGAPAGAARGTLLIAGHVDVRGKGLGAFAALYRLGPGDRVEVTGADGRVRPYRLTARRTYARQALPADLFSRSGPHRLALVTCAGRYDRATGGYADNLVLYGTPVKGTGTREPPGRAGAAG
ncbi:class F sortase [Streptomyces sp. AM 4-1-1]|uniref:class F sortase n=1 Tax=Streptomyces sp. AM 4-1-1 TaxID=3028710 RepID=UPI0023B9705B|nr:class F sortase [Streptomyces sp. AM 4-1-1]WEH36371.1 class F sortase [Streptomyces sp. AM 4-1-1]